MSVFLGLLSGQSFNALPPNLSQLWQWSLRASTGSWYGDDENHGSLLRRLEDAYAEQMAKVSWESEKRAKILTWCLEVAQQRVNAIVSNKYRKAYDRAAVLITACAEVLRLQGSDREANALLNDVRGRFPRHRAFQVELKAAIQRSEK